MKTNNPPESDSPLSEQDLQTCISLLQQVQCLPADDPGFLAVERAAAYLFKSAKKKRRLERKRQKRIQDRSAREQTGIVQSRREREPPKEALPRRSDLQLARPQYCYICKQPYQRLHHYYHRLCPDCGEFNLNKRLQTVDLTRRRALVTGGRVKIGFQTALKLLRDGAEVMITTRFPRDAARRYAGVPDYHQWRRRLTVYGLDFRSLPAVLAFIDMLSKEQKTLDIIINNAAQTIQRPPSFFRDMASIEAQPLPDSAKALLAGVQPGLMAPETDELSPSLPPGLCLDEDDQPLDTRPINSWALELQDVEPREMVEAQVVNAMAPFLFNSRLIPLMIASPHQPGFIINVSAMEGKFDYARKTSRHPHTNMAKAALNMMTRTSARAYAEKNIYMNSVDTGWITDEKPHPQKQKAAEQGFSPPLDAIDGAARIYDPIVQGCNGNACFGYFYKNYHPTSW